MGKQQGQRGQGCSPVPACRQSRARCWGAALAWAMPGDVSSGAGSSPSQAAPAAPGIGGVGRRQPPGTDKKEKLCHPATIQPFSFPSSLAQPCRQLFVVRARTDTGELPARGHVEAATASTAPPPGSAQSASGWPGGEQEFGMTPPHLNHCLLSLTPHPARGEPLRPPSQHHPILHPQPFTRSQRLLSPPSGLCRVALCSPSPQHS